MAKSEIRKKSEAVEGKRSRRVRYAEAREQINPLDGIVLEELEPTARTPRAPSSEEATDKNSETLESSASWRFNSPSESSASPAHLRLMPVFRSDAHGIWLYHGDCLAVLDAIAAKHPGGCFDMIFADPPYFLSNGGVTCHAGRMVKVDKGDWDKSRGAEENHNFNRAWLERCQRALKPNGTLWVTGTHHVIFSVGFAMQQLGFKILNVITWEKPNPPPNLSCRYFTHSTETILWAAKNEKSKHRFNYAEMKKVTGKQMKTVWRKEEFLGHKEAQKAREGKELTADDADNADAETLSAPSALSVVGKNSESSVPSVPFRGNSSACASSASSAPLRLNNVWTVPPPTTSEKQFGKHPTQKPVALLERILLACTNRGDLVLDPFLGNGTTAVACARLKRRCVGIELEKTFVEIAAQRVDANIIEIWLREFRVNVFVSVIPNGGRGVPARGSSHQRNDPNDLDLIARNMDRISQMADKPEIATERIYHETKFVFLSCAHVKEASVVHTTVSVDLQEAWSRTPQSVKRETTHIVRCETEIFRVKTS